MTMMLEARDLYCERDERTLFRGLSFTRCMDCFHVCPEPHVLRAPVLDEQSPAQVTHRDCMTCGRCVDVCSEDVFTITIRNIIRDASRR
ncbi:ferredoxin-type protein NapH [Salmonella enterica subsp. enterica serovar Typhimurium str. DT104]|nr:ferredoxin-type protein NapH [Salmonella enterica subsp. enterica serovar Typhimurium str. DT104]CQO24709.1 ferredoxin-type protein NapH [Salmonella enterica subsp. enterica serovar Typhimurium str. DT104]